METFVFALSFSTEQQLYRGLPDIKLNFSWKCDFYSDLNVFSSVSVISEWKQFPCV